jgi:hypothetical protein
MCQIVNEEGDVGSAGEQRYPGRLATGPCFTVRTSGFIVATNNANRYQSENTLQSSENTWTTSANMTVTDWSLLPQADEGNVTNKRPSTRASTNCNRCASQCITTSRCRGSAVPAGRQSPTQGELLRLCAPETATLPTSGFFCRRRGSCSQGRRARPTSTQSRAMARKHHERTVHVGLRDSAIRVHHKQQPY